VGLVGGLVGVLDRQERLDVPDEMSILVHFEARARAGLEEPVRAGVSGNVENRIRRSSAGNDDQRFAIQHSS